MSRLAVLDRERAVCPRLYRLRRSALRFFRAQQEPCPSPWGGRCSPRELVARIRAILRRVAGNENNRGPVQVGKLQIDLAQRRAHYDGKQIPLTGTELSLLEMLARSAGQPVPKAEIYPRILGRPMGRYDRAIDVHISAIRHKLAQEGVEGIAIESVRGVGYQLVRLD